MNCDQAFEHLTDPDLWDSDVLSRHLASCARCRQMQETLSPALVLFGDGAGREEASQADTSFGFGESNTRTECFLSPEAVEIAEQAARELALTRPITRTVLRPPTAWTARIAAMILLGSAIALGMFGSGFQKSPTIPELIPAKDALCTRDHLKATDSTSTTRDATAVVRSCMVCHVPNDLPSEDRPAVSDRPVRERPVSGLTGFSG